LAPAKAILFLKVVEPFVKSKTLGNILALALNAKKTTNMMIVSLYVAMTKLLHTKKGDDVYRLPFHFVR